PLVAAAFALYVRAGEGTGVVVPVVRDELRWLGRGLVGVVLALVVAGTLVTGSGPNGGDPAAPRYGFNVQDVAQLHADIVWLTIGLTFALLLALRLTGAPARATRAAAILLGVELAQGVLGYVQYFLGVPQLLVMLHVLGAALVWIATLNVFVRLRERSAEPRVVAGREARPVP
ncbi:MAG: heme A synthase, partial [Actinobacteria bacterium]|nr:heme A synthase [Actinomycetota bacterium]